MIPLIAFSCSIQSFSPLDDTNTLSWKGSRFRFGFACILPSANSGARLFGSLLGVAGVFRMVVTSVGAARRRLFLGGARRAGGSGGGARRAGVSGGGARRAGGSGGGARRAGGSGRGASRPNVLVL